jgi:hypothetical protein
METSRQRRSLPTRLDSRAPDLDLVEVPEAPRSPLVAAVGVCLTTQRIPLIVNGRSLASRICA